MAINRKTSKQPGKATNKAKNYRRAFAKKTGKYKSDTIDKVCTTFVSSVQTLPNNADPSPWNRGALTPIANVQAGSAFTISATIALDARNPLLANPSHGSYINLFNEWNTSAVHLDLLFSPKLRENADQVFMLVERSNITLINDEDAMCSDVNHRMYQLGNNTQKLTFKQTFGTAQDKINKKSTSTAANNPPGTNDLTYVKILCIGKNNTSAQINLEDLQIKMRAKLYNKYRDMKVLTSALN